MSYLVRIDASSTPETSHSKALAEFYQVLWQNNHPNGSTIYHNLIDLNLPHINQAFIDAMYTDEAERSINQKQTLEVSNHFVTELKQATTLLISTPMYNFTIPSQLKTYIDHITRAGETFRYGENGPEGLLDIEEVIVIIASGGDYTKPPMDAMNFVKPYLKTILGFNGLNNITFIEAPGMSRSEERKQASLEVAKQKINNLI
ncbi:MAG: NAD(P)H-dependent oxidoreductase [Pseudomonadota bacterium]|nr:NAD(P)H-dependent oxidoreductase [Pseudomonadota bacterium]